MKIEYTRGALAVTVWALVSLTVFAQHEGHQLPGAGSAVSPSSCAQSSQGITRSIDVLNSRIDEARQTNDAATMRAAVGEVQVALAQMKTQLADCTALTQDNGAAGSMGVDHSKMQMAPGASVVQPGSPASAADTKTASPMAGMDHSKMEEKSSPAASATPSKAAQASTVVFTLRTLPAPTRNGKNDFEVTLKDSDGKAIADAEVSLAFYMPAMPSMKTPDVRLTSTGNGSYKGSATMGMAGDWDVTVKASRSGQQLDTKKMRLTAK